MARIESACQLDVVYGFRINNEKLTLELGNLDPVALNVISANQMSYQGIYADFERKYGVIMGFKIMAGRVKNLSFTKQ